MPALIEQEFDAAMAQLGVGARPRLTVGVSGGADSMALAILAQDWASKEQGSILALIVDHGLRQESALEAKITQQRLETRGIAARVITLSGLGGAKLQETARRARHAALAAATREAGALFLLLGHHAADQSETVAMRAKRGNFGLEGMALWTARNDAVLLRPLLAVEPARLRVLLREQNIGWVEDPSNRDPRFERVRVRLIGTEAVPEKPSRRRQTEADLARFLACYSSIRPEGFALLRTDAAPAAALAALLRTIGGAQYAPGRGAVAALACKLRPATLGGVRILKSGKLGPGWLLVRESGSCGPPIPARRGTVWDGRFRLLEDVAGGVCSAVGPDTAMFRNASDLPVAVLSALPCIRMTTPFVGGPRLAKAFFQPPIPAVPLPFLA